MQTQRSVCTTYTHPRGVRLIIVFVFLHYHIAYFPGPFENIIKELKEASDVEARRGLAGDGRISAFPWAEHLHRHIPLGCAVPSMLKLSKTGGSS